MTEKYERRQRKELLRQLKQCERAEAEDSIPLKKRELKELFDWVDKKLEMEKCDHSLRHTKAFLQVHGLPEQEIVAWIAEYGGYCDCEVIANVEDKWDEIVGSV